MGEQPSLLATADQRFTSQRASSPWRQCIDDIVAISALASSRLASPHQPRKVSNDRSDRHPSVANMNPHQKNKVDVKNLSPEEQRLFRLYGKLPSRSDHFAKHLKDRKYFDSGDYAMSKAGKGDGIDAGAVGSEHPVAENIPHLSSPVSNVNSSNSSSSAGSAPGAGPAAQPQNGS